MAQAQSKVVGRIAHTELASTNPAASRKFLEKVFGWKFQSVPNPAGPYLMYETPGGGRGGVRGTQPTETPAVVTYIEVADIAEAQKQVEKNGAKIVMPRVDVPGMGSFFWFQVPSGPVLACWQAA